MDSITIATSIQTAINVADKIAVLIRQSSKADKELLRLSNELLITLTNISRESLSQLAEMYSTREAHAMLEKKVVELEEWFEKEKPSYALKDICRDVFVYERRKIENSPEPQHWLCARCFDNNKKSILQRTGIDFKGTYYICHECNSPICDDSKKRQPNPGNNPRITWKY